MNGKNLPPRLHCCHQKLVHEAIGMLDLHDLTWYDSW
jgi:hypothetical protein